MAKITDPDDLNVGTEITLDTSAKTFTLVAAGALVAKDGVTLQALHSKFIDLWTTSTYNKFPFPIYTIDARSGQYIFGFDGSTYNGWQPANDVTRQMLRDGGWEERSGAGALTRVYVGVVSLGDVSAAAQLYYQREAAGAAINATFVDELNEGLQVFGDASNGNFDTRNFFKLFCREQGKTYDDAVLGDVGETGTGPFKLALPVSNADDLKILDVDATVDAAAPYTGITVTYFGTDQARVIGGVSYNFRVIIAGNAATAEEIYTKIQRLLRSAADIDSGAGTVVGKTASSLLRFVGDTLITSQGVYIDNYDPDDVNRLIFTDQTGVERSEPFTATGSLTFNGPLTSGGTGYFRAYFQTLPGGSDDYGESGAVTVDDAAAADIAGTITGASIAFTFAYDTNVQGGRTPATDAVVVVVAGNPGSAKPVVATATITRATGQVIALVAEQDRAYLP